MDSVLLPVRTLWTACSLLPMVDRKSDFTRTIHGLHENGLEDEFPPLQAFIINNKSRKEKDIWKRVKTNSPPL